jgi:hypothetical protein
MAKVKNATGFLLSSKPKPTPTLDGKGVAAFTGGALVPSAKRASKVASSARGALAPSTALFTPVPPAKIQSADALIAAIQRKGASCDTDEKKALVQTLFLEFTKEENTSKFSRFISPGSMAAFAFLRAHGKESDWWAQLEKIISKEELKICHRMLKIGYDLVGTPKAITKDGVIRDLGGKEDAQVILDLIIACHRPIVHKDLRPTFEANAHALQSVLRAGSTPSSTSS